MRSSRSNHYLFYIWRCLSSSSTVHQSPNSDRARSLVGATLLGLVVFFLLFHGSSNAERIRSGHDFINSAPVAYTIIVAKVGQRNFTSVQEAINSVPTNNSKWICIHVKPGIYNEKVIVPPEKPYIYLQGEDQWKTFIQWGDYGSVENTSTFTLRADNFLATDITFKNSYEALLRGYQGNNHIVWAPAVMLTGDKAAFYHCSFISIQDTLSDMQGRHYFQSCYIEGAIDFIWGNGRSQYKGCTIYSKSAILGQQPGFITAQGRSSQSENSGFVFIKGAARGDGSTYLGRAYGRYSTVIFYQTYIDENVTPLSWDAWRFKGQESTITYAQEGCSGPGSNKSGRVKWMKRMSPSALDSYINTNKFINQDRWLQNQPWQPWLA